MQESAQLLSLFAFTLSPVEIVVRGTAVYWFIFCIFRFLLRRDVGSIGIADVLLLVLISDAAQNAMAGEYKSIGDGFMLIATIVGWNYLLDWGCYRFAVLRRLVEPRPLLLIDNGRMRRDNMRREFITSEELQAKLREKGVQRIDDVQRAYLESDGEISLLLKEGKERS